MHIQVIVINVRAVSKIFRLFPGLRWQTQGCICEQNEVAGWWEGGVFWRCNRLFWLARFSLASNRLVTIIRCYELESMEPVLV